MAAVSLLSCTHLSGTIPGAHVGQGQRGSLRSSMVESHRISSSELAGSSPAVRIRAPHSRALEAEKFSVPTVLWNMRVGARGTRKPGGKALMGLYMVDVKQKHARSTLVGHHLMV